MALLGCPSPGLVLGAQCLLLPCNGPPQAHPKKWEASGPALRVDIQWERRQKKEREDRNIFEELRTAGERLWGGRMFPRGWAWGRRLFSIPAWERRGGGRTSRLQTEPGQIL